MIPQVKVCSSCKDEKELSEFGNSKKYKDKHCSQCKLCRSVKYKKYCESNPEKEKIRKEKWAKANTKKSAESTKRYRENHPDIILEYNKNYYKNNITKEKTRKKKWLENNPNHQKNRILTEPLFRLKRNMTSMVYNAFRNNGYSKNGKRTHEIISCDFESFKNHIETQWSLPSNLNENGEVWMSWDNYGRYNGELNYGWDIDHRMPTSSAKTEEELIGLFKYTNLQPLCSYVNRTLKRAKIGY